MKKIKVMLVIVLLFAILTGCANGSTPEPTKKSDPTATEEAPVSTEATSVEESPEAVAEDGSLADHPVYDLVSSTIYFDGVRPYQYESRADIPKALPLKIKGDVPFIAMPISRMSSEIFVEYVDFALKRCDEYGYRFEFTDAAGSTEKQRADFDAFVTKGADVILINPLDPISNELDVERAVEQGVAVIGFGIAFFPSAGAITCVGQPSYLNGWALAEKSAESLKGEHIDLAMIIGRYGQSMMESKANGYLAGLIYSRFEQLGKPFATKEDAMLYSYDLYLKFRDNGKLDIPEADISIVASGEGLLTANNAMKIAEDILTAHPDINLLYVDTHMEGEGVLLALDTLNIPYGIGDGELRVVFCDGAPDWAMDLLTEGKVLAIVHNNPAIISNSMVDLVHDLIEGNMSTEKANNLTISSYFAPNILTKDNVDEFRVEGEKYAVPLPIPFVSVDEWNEEHQ